MKNFKSARELLAERQGDYKAVFDPSGARTDAVLADLKKFCRADSSTFHPDARQHALLEGRREVFLRLQDFLTLSLDELCVKYKAIEIPPPTTEQ